MRTGFTPEIRDQIRQGAVDSADVVVPLLLDEFPEARRIIDVGCGEGWWTRRFAQAPLVSAVGVDLDAPAEPEPDVEFLRFDLTQPLVPLIDERFDLAVSLEVAEHLPAPRAAGFVKDLCTLAPVVVFSAAIPGQGGTGHLNEQPPAYWAALFKANGFVTSGYLRWRIWDDGRVENWYRQNLLVAFSDDAQIDYTVDRGRGAWEDVMGDAPPRFVVHPVLFDARR